MATQKELFKRLAKVNCRLMGKGKSKEGFQIVLKFLDWIHRQPDDGSRTLTKDEEARLIEEDKYLRI
jgi:hypothetical protein